MATAFISYSHRDEAFRQELETHLAPLRRQGLLDQWHDRKMTAGDALDDTISAHLEQADLILMLISADFVASDYCYAKEMARAIERHEAGQARAISIVCRPCDFHDLPFARFVLLPTDAKPVSTWVDRDSAWLDVVRGIRKALEPQQLVPQQRSSVVPATASGPSVLTRSSARPNLLLPRKFSDLDKHDFLVQAFEDMFGVFKENGVALEEDNPGVTFRQQRIDAQAFSFRIFSAGKEVAAGSLYHGGGSFGRNQICYNSNPDAPRNSMNKWFTVEATEQALALAAGGMGYGGERDALHDPATAANDLWHDIIEQARSRLP
jgi:hypothetical protein